MYLVECSGPVVPLFQSGEGKQKWMGTNGTIGNPILDPCYFLHSILIVTNPLNKTARLDLKILVDGVDGQFFRFGKNGLNSVFLQFFLHQFLFK